MTDKSIPEINVDVETNNENIETIVNNKDESITAATTTTTIIDESDCESECSSRSEEDIVRSALEVETNAFTRFIERQRLEVMYELRRLRLGERPVTGQPNRERIQTFLNDVQDRRLNRRVPSTRPPMPSARMADIDALTNRRCVSAALGSAAFRQDLENTIRQSIGMQPMQLTPQPTPRAVTPIPVVEQQQQQQQQQHYQQQHTVQQLNIERRESEIEAWQNFTQLQRERIVVEISDLVHRQLVTSALESDFRRHLERNVLDRLEHGAPPQQVTPTVVAPRIIPQPTNTNVTNTNMDTLTSRLDSMQQMIQLMFTMQMDMQRSIRQEIAGALAADRTTTNNSATQPMQAGQCTVCLTAIADTVLYRCGHLCVCYMCGLQLQQSRTVYGVKCPICRAPVEDILRVYRSSRDGEETSNYF